MRRTGYTGVLLLFIAAATAGAHETGVLALGSATVSAGGAITVEGSDFAEGERFTLFLRGALTEYELGSVESDADGRFTTELRLAGDVRSGNYKLVAIAPDGDEAGSADVTVENVEGAGEAEPADVDEAGPGAPAPQARSDELRLERDWSGFEWFVVGVVLTGALVGGLTLLRRDRAA